MICNILHSTELNWTFVTYWTANTAEQTFSHGTRFLAPDYTALPKDDCITLQFFGDKMSFLHWNTLHCRPFGEKPQTVLSHCSPVQCFGKRMRNIALQFTAALWWQDGIYCTEVHCTDVLWWQDEIHCSTIHCSTVLRSKGDTLQCSTLVTGWHFSHTEVHCSAVLWWQDEMQESGLSDGQSADRETKWATHASRNKKKYRIQDTNTNAKTAKI